MLSVSGAPERSQDGGGREWDRGEDARLENSARGSTAGGTVTAPAAVVSDNSVAVLCDRHFACSLDGLLQGVERLYREQEGEEGQQPAPEAVGDLEVVAR